MEDWLLCCGIRDSSKEGLDQEADVVTVTLHEGTMLLMAASVEEVVVTGDAWQLGAIDRDVRQERLTSRKAEIKKGAEGAHQEQSPKLDSQYQTTIFNTQLTRGIVNLMSASSSIPSQRPPHNLAPKLQVHHQSQIIPSKSVICHEKQPRQEPSICPLKTFGASRMTNITH